MNSRTSALDARFLQQQRRRLIELREQLEKAIQGAQVEETDVTAQSAGDAQELEDDAQRLALLEVEGTLIRNQLQRLVQVKRALQKLDEGTYGISDTDGAAIPKERLMVMPEAIESVTPTTSAR